MGGRLGLAWALSLALCAGSAWAAQGEARVPALPPPPLDASAAQLLDQPYLRPAERLALRLKHGAWEASDLASEHAGVGDRARAALMVGAFDDASLRDPASPAALRAHALLRTGEPQAALALLEGDASMLAARLSAEALMDLGRASDAADLLTTRVAQRVEAFLAEGGGGLASAELADQAAEAARGLLLLARLRGAEGPGTFPYQRILDVLGDARTRVDRLSPSVPFAESLLLHEKDDFAQLGDAVQAALTLNPMNAEAWLLLGRVHVDAFDFPKAEAVASRLDVLASSLAPAVAPAPETDEEDQPVGASAPAPPPSLYGEMVRVLVRLRQNEGAAALEQLRDMRARYPNQRELRALEAAATAVAFDFDGADRVLAELDALAPSTPAGYLLAGRTLALARQYEDAARLLAEAARRAPLWAEPLIELGLSELQAGRLEPARAALEKGLRLDSLHVRGRNSLLLLEEIASYHTVESDHFVVRYKPGESEVLAREMLPQLERTFLRVTGDGPGGIRHVPEAKTVIELYPNHRWFSTRITGLPALHTFAAATGPVIAMELPKVGPGHSVGAYDWARVVQHEYVHTVTLSKTRNRLPHWFTEASAVFLEDAPMDFNSIQILARAASTGTFFDFETINVMFVRPRRPTDRALAYMQGAWMYQYLIERFGNEAPLRLMELYAQGTREPEAFQSVLAISREQFFDDFSAWANAQLQAWGMAPSDANPALETLLERIGADGTSPEALTRLLREHPTNPFVLDAALDALLAARGAAGPTGEDVALLRAYAQARPVDPLPHRLLARLLLAGAVPGESPDAAVPHLEFLDAREQNSPSFALELARIFARQANWPRALASITRATQIAPYDPALREEAARIVLRAAGAGAAPQRDVQLRDAERHLWALTIIEPNRPEHRQRLEALRARLVAPPPAP